MTHAGLPKAPVDQCRAWFEEEYLAAGQERIADLPQALFAKNMVKTLPKGLDPQDFLVSGHVPQRRAYAKHQRFVVDTTGGAANRPLAAVRLPAAEILLSQP